MDSAEGGHASTAPKQAKAKHSCARCGAEPARLRCGGCKAQWYCKKACQVAAWKAGHKAECSGRKPVELGEGGLGRGLADAVRICSRGVDCAVKTRTRKPTVDEFAIPATDIGAGNFSRVMKATHLKTKEVFALKQLDKAKIARLRKRHPNVNNEILMEKRVLSKLRHPGIIRLYHTFQVGGLRAGLGVDCRQHLTLAWLWQDAGHLYFLLEHVDGSELWKLLMEDEHQVGMALTHARYFTRQILVALEYLHSQRIVHR